MQEKDYEELLQKYKAKIKEEFGEEAALSQDSKVQQKVSSKEYSEFKSELFPGHYSLYEKACNFSDKILQLKNDPKKNEQLQKNLDLCHLNVKPSGVNSLAILVALVFIIIGGVGGFAISLLLAGEGGSPSLFLPIFFLFVGLLLIPAMQKIPEFMANTWRMKASNQMVQSVFYLVTYMRHTSNLERAIEFAADHLEPPLSLDFRKILWDIETQKYSNITEAAETFLQIWKEWDKDFVESFHLIESSLYESSEDRRLALLDKSLEVILNGTYENMLHYAHELKSPMTMLHMLGIILPVLGLVILPLVVSFMGDTSNPFTTTVYIALLYNFALPAAVFYLGKNILSKRPAGYGSADISEKPELKSFRNVKINMGKLVTLSFNPLLLSLVILIVGLAIGFSPIILHAFGAKDFAFNDSGSLKMLEYVCSTDNLNCKEEEKFGPYGLGASMLSLMVILGLGLAVGLFFKLRAKNVIEIRNRTKELEEEFASALFQLGNRLGDGLPAEIAFAKVAETMRGTTSGDFFSLAERNITKLGMGLEQAIFDSKVGALVYFPSEVIQSSMKVLSDSIKKGPRIAAQALLSMSRYIKEIRQVEERLKDLMADVISSMKSQIQFLTPSIAGIVIGITSMISAILTRLSGQLACFSKGGGEFAGTAALDMFGLGVPTFYFQVVVGIYIIQIVYILTVLSNGIENGVDKLGERFELGKNMIRSTILYCALAGLVMLLFNLFATTVMSTSFATC